MGKYSELAIAEKLREIEEFEAQYGPNTITAAWRKWCTDEGYREKEQQFRNGVANTIYAKGITN